MTSLLFTIDFHGPFHVLIGHADGNTDLTVDPENLLPASSLKGVMRATARQLLAPGVVDATFGSAATGSIWSWSDADFSGDVTCRRRSRIAIGENGIVAKGALVSFQEVWADRAEFTIDQLGPATEELLDAQTKVLALSASMVRSLGASRNRGFGWVSIRPSTIDVSTLAGLISGGAQQ